MSEFMTAGYSSSLIITVHGPGRGQPALDSAPESRTVPRSSTILGRHGNQTLSATDPTEQMCRWWLGFRSSWPDLGKLGA